MTQMVKSLPAMQETQVTWRRKWQPTPVFLPGEFHRQKRLAGYSLRSQRIRHPKQLSQTERETTGLSLHHIVRKQIKKAVICKPRRDFSPDTEFAGILILNIQPPEPKERKKCLLFKPPSLQYLLCQLSELKDSLPSILLLPTQVSRYYSYCCDSSVFPGLKCFC